MKDFIHSILPAVIIFVFYFLLQGCDSVPAGIPVNAGETVRFNCSVDSRSSVDWQYAKTKDSNRINIFIGYALGGGGRKSNGYTSRPRYRIQMDIRLGRYDLIIDNVTTADEGFYFCSDVSEPMSTTSMKLNVHGKEEDVLCKNDVVTSIGDIATFDFPIAKKGSIQLEHRSVDRNYPLHVFRDGRLVNEYYALSGRFSFSASNGSWILTIKNVQSLDAGSFICSEDNGLGKQYVKELVAVNTNEVVCSTDADKCQQELNVTCAANYSGHCVPRLQFNLDGNIRPRNESRVTMGNTVSLRAVVDWGNVPLCRIAVQNYFVTRTCTLPENSCEELNSGQVSKKIAIVICTVIPILIIIVTVIIIIVLSHRKRLRRRNGKQKVLKTEEHVEMSLKEQNEEQDC